MNEVFNNYFVDYGMIMMWSGDVEEVPQGWAVCDGGEYERSDGIVRQVVDLRGKFIIGFSVVIDEDGLPTEEIDEDVG